MTRDRRDGRQRKATARPGRDAPPRETPRAAQPVPAVGSRRGHPGAPSGARAGELERSAGPPGRSRAIPWSLVGALAILPLLWASRSPTLGLPVADDYVFLSRLAFERPLDFFGPMGAAYYWRPVSRQLYYLLVGPWLLRAPWVATLLAVLLLLGLYAVLYRLARRGFSPPLSAAIACFPLLSEPARVLLAWPSASQHLLGALFAALAVERAVAGGLFLSGLAALLALLSNEAAFLVLPALPLIGWFRARSRREVMRWGAVAFIVGALWAAGYAVARTRGAGLPGGAEGAAPWTSFVAVLVQALVSQLGYEGLTTILGPVLVPLSGVLVALGLAVSFRRASRRQIVRAAPALLGGLVWFVAGVVPLVFVLPDWNAWRTTVASLGLAFALTGWLGLAEPALAGMLVMFRLVVLLLAVPAPAVVENAVPGTASSFSLARIVRLQRIVESTRRALMAGAPTLPRGGIVRYWQMPLLAEVGFNGNRAPQVWYRDSTLTLRFYGGDAGMRERSDAVVEIEAKRPWPAVLIRPEAMRCYREAFRANTEGRTRAADSLLAAAWEAQPEDAPRFFSNLAQNRAQLAWKMNEYARADSLNRLSFQLSGESAPYWATAARLALLQGDLALARSAVRRCLALNPMDPTGRELAQRLGEAAPPLPR